MKVKARSIAIYFDDDMLLLTACPNVGEIVIDGACTCPVGHSLKEGTCEGNTLEIFRFKLIRAPCSCVSH